MPVGQNRTNPGLENLQALLYRLITAPEGVAAGLAAERARGPALLDELHNLRDSENFEDLEDLIESDDRLSATERLEIYANAYFYRILDCLKEDFPATLAMLGGDNFHNLVTGYLIEYPPTEPSISHAGRHLAEFLRHHPIRERWPFIGDLARLERTLIEVFHAADAEPLKAAAMRALAPDDWPALTLRAHPALAIVDCEWRVDLLLREVEAATGTGDHIHGEPAHAPVSVLVWRRGSRVNYRPLERSERAGLELARAEASFAAICEAIAAVGGEHDPIAPVALINRLLARWIEEGLLVQAGR
jgi:hypothetical protein